MGINVQLANNKKLDIYTLGIIELNKKHTAENIKEEIERILSEFSINKRQVYAVTTDNGRNMLKAVDRLSDSNVEDEAESIFDSIIEKGSITSGNVVSVKCAAHTLQLAVKDFLSQFDSNITKTRQVVKKLRTPSFS